MRDASHSRASSGLTARRNLVLCSGGIDSAVVAWQGVSIGLAPELVFIDYGQPARRAEKAAAGAIAEALRVPVFGIRIEVGAVPTAGEIPFRNALLVTAAAAAFPDAATLSIGIHAGTEYADCSPEFVDAMQSVIDLCGYESMRVSAPLLNFTKAEVIRLARDSDVPLELTHSCEAADEPCGTCRSCSDRGAFVAL